MGQGESCNNSVDKGIISIHFISDINLHEGIRAEYKEGAEGKGCGKSLERGS